MSQKQLQRIKAMENVAQARLTIREAAELLALSQRQVKRLKQRFDAEDVGWVYHGNRGQRPANCLPDMVRDQVSELARGRYAGFNDHHLQEKLTQQEGLRRQARPAGGPRSVAVEDPWQAAPAALGWRTEATNTIVSENVATFPPLRNLR